MKNLLLLALLSVVAVGCSSVTKTKDSYTAHAESFNILFFRIPGGNT